MFEKREDEQQAQYFGYGFFLFFSSNFRAWFLMYDDMGDTLDAGNVGCWDERPTSEQVRQAVEGFLHLRTA